MTGYVATERKALIDTLTDMLGDLATVVTIDAQEARPLPGKIAVLIDPPEITFDGWQFVTPVWTVNLIAGTMATQTAAMDLLIDAVERLQGLHLNMKDAKPSTFSIAGVGSLAAYTITLNPLEITEDE
ncbi:hypothetical protein [Bifidobacterium vansinderenii]|uniref:Phage protein n=1 Tax=Bifidobacterium vansinderenii TaxID=1984871 RepID=A0A229VZY2_9BIFI|nr:hypothetical protein [Bifidobacterium vansinderenii]OXN01116.1 hypothetical protein Tam10B_0695 [Bifidobacterium vansinderenii]